MNRRSRWSVAVACAVASTAPSRAAEQRSSLGPSAIRSPVLEKKVEQGILTPVPVELTLPANLPARRVLAHYKIWGSKEWTTLELNRVGSRWAGAIPCLEVSTITGDVLYYLRVHDAEGAVIAYSGSRHQPYRVTIVHDSLRPGRIAAGRCPDPADCPPGLPGCPSERVESVPCKSDADCEGGLTCGWEGVCEQDPRAYDWLSLGVEAGIGVVPTAGACSVASQESQGYLCLRGRDGEPYAGRPAYRNESLAIGTTPVRVVLGYERLIAYRNTLGVRVGYALTGEGPDAPEGSRFVPFSAELRASHYFGRDPFASHGARPYVFADAGYAMYDIEVSADVREDFRRPSVQGGNDLEQTLTVWKRAGDAFVGTGAGVLLAPSADWGVTVEARAGAVFPFGALALTGYLGWQRGF